MEDCLRMACETGSVQNINEILATLTSPQAKAALINDSKALIKAARNGNYEALKLLLSHGADIHVTDDIKDGTLEKTALHWASLKGHCQVAQLIIENGGEVNANKGITALHCASGENHEKVAELLIQNGAEVDAVTVKTGLTPLHVASWNGHIDLVRLLIAKNANVRAVAKDGRTPLHFTSRHDRLQIAKILIENGANVDAADVDGYTPLHYGATGGHPQVEELLIEKGANVNAVTKKMVTPLHNCAEKGHCHVAKILIANGANLGALDKNGWSVLHWASRYDQLQMVEFLLNLNVNVQSLDENDWTPLHIASFFGYSQVAELLINNYANVNAICQESLISDHSQQTPLHFASKNGHLETVKVLLRRGASADAVDKKGWTPLHWASEEDHLQVVAELIFQMEVDIDAVGNDGWTPLHAAARRGNWKVAELLIENGAVDAYCWRELIKNEQPLYEACASGSLEEMEKILAPLGGREEKRILINSSGALAAAVTNLRLEVVRALLYYGSDANLKDVVHLKTALDLVAGRCILGTSEKDCMLIAAVAELIIQNGGGDMTGMTRTPLHYASSSCNLAMAKMLLENGANVNAGDSCGNTPLHMASHRTNYFRKWPADEGNSLMIELLLKWGADVNATDEDGWTPLHRALQRGNPQMAEQLILGGANLVAANVSKATSLAIALSIGHVSLIHLIIDALKSQLLLDLALKAELNAGNSEAAELLMTHGANGDIHEIIAVNDQHGASVLYHALKKRGKNSVVDKLLENTASGGVNEQLAIAIASDDAKVFQALLMHPKVNNYIKINSGHLFLVLKTQNKQMEWQESVEHLHGKLTEAGVPLHNELDSGISVLGYACKNGHIGAVEYFIAHMEKSCINAGNPSPLWLACNHGHSDIVKLLLKHDDHILDTEKKAPDGTTGLIMAVARADYDTVNAFAQCPMYPSVKVLENCAKFGKHQLFETVVHHLDLASLENEAKMNILQNAAESSCLVTLAAVMKLLKFSGDKFEAGSLHTVLIRKQINMSAMPLISNFVKLSKKFSAFNNQVEIKYEKKKNTTIVRLNVEDDVRPVILGDFCFIKAFRSKTLSEKRPPIVLFLKDMDHIEEFQCQHINGKELMCRPNCQIIMDLLSACRHLEAQLNQARDEGKSTVMTQLKPQFALIGSVAEGTKLHRTSELDITVKFHGLEDKPFTVADNAMEILATHDCLKKFQTEKESKAFDYPSFLQYFLEEIQQALMDVHCRLSCNLKINLPQKMEIPDATKSGEIWTSENSFKFCQNCKSTRANESIYEPSTHCIDCLPGVTHTKLGPCLIFQWNDGSLKKPLVVTVDLVTLFPISGKGVLDLYNIVTSSLVDKRPPGWLSYFNSLLKQDIIFPEAFSSSNSSRNVNVGMKLINYGPCSNYIIKPAQEMEVQDFESIPKLKEVYLYMKAFKDILGVDVKSYYIKKVLLLPDIKARVIEDSLTSDELLYDILSQPYLKKAFAARISFDKWRGDLDEQKFVGANLNWLKNTIPLCWTEEHPDLEFLKEMKTSLESS